MKDELVVLLGRYHSVKMADGQIGKMLQTIKGVPSNDVYPVLLTYRSDLVGKLSQIEPAFATALWRLLAAGHRVNAQVISQSGRSADVELTLYINTGASA